MYGVCKKELSDLEKNLKRLVAPILQAYSVELVDLKVGGTRGSQTVKVYIDAVGGVTLDKCTAVSRELSDQLDIADIIPGKYRLEISSPGVDRPLAAPSDFKRNLNREVEVWLDDDTEKRKVHGIIVNVTENEIWLNSAGEEVRIPFASIQHGKLSLPW